MAGGGEQVGNCEHGMVIDQSGFEPVKPEDLPGVGTTGGERERLELFVVVDDPSGCPVLAEWVPPATLAPRAEEP